MRNQSHIDADIARLKLLRSEVAASPFPQMDKQAEFFTIVDRISQDIADYTGLSSTLSIPDKPQDKPTFDYSADKCLMYIDFQFKIPRK